MIKLTIHNEDMTKSYTITPYLENNILGRLWIKTEDGEGMPITMKDLFDWIDKGYMKKF